MAITLAMRSGPYRLVRALGSGGMGMVWLAERTDGLVNRPVALKLPHRTWKRAGLVERLSREREILATLTHPNIARLYDAGLTEEGRPFLAIEYVEGPAIDEYCHDHQLDTKARVALFAQGGGRLRKLGSALLAARSAGEAAERLDEAVRFSVAAKSELEALHARGSLGLALTYLGGFDEAERQLRLTIDKSVKSTRAHFLAMRNLGTLLRLQGRYAESLAWLEQALAESGIQPGHRGDHAHVLVEAGQVRLERGEIETAGELFGRAEKLFNDVQKQRITPARADIMVGMARVQLQHREYGAALDSARSASLFWRDFEPDNRSAGEAALWLGRCYQALGRKAEAAEALGRAQHLLARSPVPADLKLLQLARTPHASNDD